MNSSETQSRKTALWNGRPVVVLQEMDGNVYNYHGVVIGPEGMSIDDALFALDTAFHRAKLRGGDEWNYDDVLDEMKAAGFEEVLAAEWWEPR